MKQEKTEVLLYLGRKIQERLREKYGMETDDRYFSQQELALVDEITVVPPLEGGLEGVQLLPNLKKLIVESIGNTSFQTNHLSSMSNKDIETIAMCEKLEDLSIINQWKIDSLNCEKLSNLKSLTIKCNRNLQTISGLENLKKLEYFSCFGNESLHEIDNLEQVILNNPELYATELDVLLFPDIIGYQIQDGAFSQEAVKRLGEINGKSHTFFVEYMQNKQVNISFSRMMELYLKARNILTENQIQGDELEVVQATEDYLAKNIKYNNMSEEVLEEKPIVGARSNANGLYSAIMKGQCNSEGYTRTMQYLLKLNGIKSSIVYCESREQQPMEEEKQHSVVCLQDGNYYSDPCHDAVAYGCGQSLKTRKQMEENYKFDSILPNKISVDLLKSLGARMGGLEKIKEVAQKDMNRGKEEVKEEEGKIHERN